MAKKPKILIIMRISAFLLFVCVFSSYAGTMNSQTAKVNINGNKLTVGSFINQVEKQTNYLFVYSKNEVNTNESLSVRSGKKSVAECLQEAFNRSDIKYAFENDYVILTKKSALTQITEQQNNVKRITGSVVDKNGEAIIGASVMIKGTTNGTITDVDGHFVLAEASNNATLVISYVGYVTQSIALNGKMAVKIQLLEDTKTLDEVVVVGYETQKKVNLTGAVGSVKGDVLENRPITNIGQGLQGAIPNLQVSQSGYAPGQGSSFNIRGMTSINGGEPLILVDGVVQDPNLLNPSDVENVSVLKDAASAAIYGARAAYGVVLITTKQGKKQQRPTLQVSTSLSTTKATNLPEYTDSWQYVNYMNTASVNAGGSNYFDERLVQNVKKYYDDPKNNLPVYYDPAIDLDGKYKYCGNTNWTKELYKSGALETLDATLSGGAEKMKYYASYGFMRQKGFLNTYNDTYKRHNINMFFDLDALSWLSVSARVKYTYSTEDHPSSGSNGWSGISAYGGQMKNDLRPIMPVKHPDGNWSGQGNFTNPFAVGAGGGSDKRKVNDLWLTGNIDIHPLKNLSIKGDFTFNPYSWNRDLYARTFTEIWANGSDTYPWSNPNSERLENNNDYYTAINAYVNYSLKFGKSNFKILAGYNQEKKKLKSFSAKREGLINNDLPAINRAIGQQYVDGSISSWATEGVFSRINYDYDGKYLLELNGRYDGSSKFPKGDRYAFFPSISAAWRISEEPFWKDLKSTVTNAKIRASYGSLGNQNVTSNFPYVSNYNITTAMNYILGNVLPVGVSSGSLISPSFTWEKVNQMNFGLDLGLMNDKLTFSFDVYRRNTKDMLVTGTPLPAVLGTSVPKENAADLKTYGWESIITWKDQIKDVAYSVSFNISDAQSKITKFSNPTGSLDTYYVGQKIGEIWGYESNGLFQSADEIAKSPSQTTLYGGTWNPGDVKYQDLNGDNKITYGSNTLANHGDKKIIGNNTPRFQFGLQASASWKGFDLSLFFQGTAKRDLWVGGSRFFGIGSEWDVPMKETLDFWTENNTNAFRPRPYINGSHGNWQVSTRYLQDASYIRLKQFSIGYTIPNLFMNKVGLSKARVYFTGQNVFTITKLSKLYDPEIASFNIYPIPRSYSVGLNLTF